MFLIFIRLKKYDKIIQEKGQMLGFNSDCYENQKMCDKAAILILL